MIAQLELDFTATINPTGPRRPAGLKAGKTMRFKTNPELVEIRLQKAAIAPGKRGDETTYVVTEIPRGVEPDTVIRILSETITRWAEKAGRFQYSFGELGLGKMLA